MTKRLGLWILLIILLAIALPGVIDRWQAEQEHHHYEIAVPFEEVYELTMEDTVSLDEALEALKDAGVTTISFSPVTLKKWHDQRILTVYGQHELEEVLRFTHQKMDYHQDRKGFYMTIPDNPYYVTKINEYFDPVKLMINEQPIYFIPVETVEDKDRNSLIGYDEEAIEKVKEYGFNYILRILNDEKTEVIQESIQELLKFQDDPSLTALLFTDGEVPGFPNPNLIKESAWQLHQAGYHFYTIDQVDTKGEQTFLRATNYQSVSLISLNLKDVSINEAVEKAIRGAKERQIRTIFFRFDTSNKNPLERLEGGVEFVKQVHNKMPKLYSVGQPVPLKEVSISPWGQLAGMLAGVLFTYLAISGVLNKRLINDDLVVMRQGEARRRSFELKSLLPKWLYQKHIYEILAVVGLLALIGGYFILDRLIFLQAFGLAIAIITPIYAVLTNAKGTTKLGKILVQYIRAVLISGVGIYIIVAIMNGNGFMSGIEGFRGVKLMYAIPLVMVALFVIFSDKNMSLNRVVYVFHAPVRYWHLIVLGILGLIGFYYIMRTGNTGTASEFELAMRQWLEDTLYVRPRFKEFLIGFPIYVLAIYMIGYFKAKANSGIGFAKAYRWSYLLLIPATIGFLSIVNTFSHFHIVLNASILRTIYGAGFGFVIGLILIGIFLLGCRWAAKLAQKRWS